MIHYLAFHSFSYRASFIEWPIDWLNDWCFFQERFYRMIDRLIDWLIGWTMIPLQISYKPEGCICSDSSCWCWVHSGTGWTTRWACGRYTFYGRIRGRRRSGAPSETKHCVKNQSKWRINWVSANLFCHETDRRRQDQIVALREGPRAGAEDLHDKLKVKRLRILAELVVQIATQANVLKHPLQFGRVLEPTGGLEEITFI